MKKQVNAMLVALSLLLSSQVSADGNGTINFSGRIDNRFNCMAFFGNTSSPNGSVLLPTVSVNTLATGGDTAADTAFQIQLVCDCSPVKCNGPSVYPNVRVFFESGYTVDPATGLLRNTSEVAAGGARNVNIQLLDGSNNMAPVNIGSYQNTKNIQREVLSNGDPRFPVAALRYTFPYVARYYATDAALPGKVTSIVTYVIDYS